MANRQMRRQNAKTPAKTSTRAPAVRPTLMGGGSVSRSRGGGSLLRPTWITDIISELRKVQWPSREEAWHLTWVVILVSVAVGVVLGGLDSAFGWFMEHTILR